MSPKCVTYSIVTKTVLWDYGDMLIGYARVSTEDQNLDLQRDALKKARMHEVFRGEGVGARRHQAPGVRGRPRLPGFTHQTCVSLKQARSLH